MSVVHIVLSSFALLSIAMAAALRRATKVRQGAESERPAQQVDTLVAASELADSAVMAKVSYDRGHRDRLASTHAETPHARSRVSMSGG